MFETTTWYMLYIHVLLITHTSSEFLSSHMIKTSRPRTFIAVCREAGESMAVRVPGCSCVYIYICFFNVLQNKQKN